MSDRVDHNSNKTSNQPSDNISSFNNHPHFKRPTSQRIFVNRSLQLSSIRFFGFDMDHTLATYTVEFDRLTIRLALDRLILIGYPAEMAEFQYDPSFAVRGLWLDIKYGNLLKVDTFGNILTCVHGFRILKSAEIYHFYPNKFIQFDEDRVYVLHTLYELPESYLIACIVNYFDMSPNYVKEDTGVSQGDIFISYSAMYKDVIDSVEYLYNRYIIQKEVIENLPKYILRNKELPLLLNRIHENNAKTFLLTNGDYEYTNKMMSYLLHGFEDDRDWRSYFDYIVVDAHKPVFFEQGTSLKLINQETGQKNIGSHSGPLFRNRVYSGGSCDVFSKLIGSHGTDVLYTGDHIYGDIIKSKKERAWRTFLIVPELAKELVVWHDKRDLFSKIGYLNDQLSEMLMNFDSSDKLCPDTSKIKENLEKCIHEMEMSYSHMGSAFRTGSQQTHFASQIMRYADMYASTCLNLLHYPFFYLFKAPSILMPHELTVDPSDPYEDAHKDYRIDRSAHVSKNIDTNQS